ncbi:hypothetical protein L5515_009625 [Caenorhabditis briggsae]|uniref:Uncharacterized protein n=1 Tax=Caenorhabditis briggsae TaxID=6238 RepID=A0AAE9JN99_CAEBR|nr:hypothetical protein L5515_009625 [Caenorhabditis briggsae]
MSPFGATSQQDVCVWKHSDFQADQYLPSVVIIRISGYDSRILWYHNVTQHMPRQCFSSDSGPQRKREVCFLCSNRTENSSRRSSPQQQQNKNEEEPDVSLDKRCPYSESQELKNFYCGDCERRDQNRLHYT